MKKILFLIVPNGFRDEEYDIPKRVFEKNNIEVVTCSDKPGPLTGKLGKVTANVDILLKDVKIEDYDAIAIAGGQDYFWNNPKILEMLKTMDQAKKPIGAICISGCIPAQADIMKGRKCTVFETPASVEEIKKHGAIYTGEQCTVDGNVVTAEGPTAAKNFAEEIVKQLS
ncbi:MAG: DJ-1/PfpI family protein [Candidatus Margulisbacteria bacterium]|nr:DJ-1/PfpI family protein [Candidatus Margulisiibacteriota bacterium]